MRTLPATILLLFSIWPLTVEAARLQGGRSLSDTKHGYQIVSDQVRAGKVSQRFEVRAGDCGESDGWSDCDNNRERSEFSVEKRWSYGRDQWIGLSVYLPEDFKTSQRVNTTVGQIHQRGGPSGTAGGLPSYPPLMQMEMKGNTYSMCLHILSGSKGNVKDECKRFTLATGITFENMSPSIAQQGMSKLQKLARIICY